MPHSRPANHPNDLNTRLAELAELMTRRSRGERPAPVHTIVIDECASLLDPPGQQLLEDIARRGRQHGIRVSVDRRMPAQRQYATVAELEAAAGRGDL